MRCSLSLRVAVAVLIAGVAGWAQSRPYNIGTPASPDEIRALDHTVGPDGKELPSGSGTAKEGAKIFADRCSACHGPNGEGGGMANRLVIGGPDNPHRGLFKFNEKSATIYYPYATIAWDYINRAMPADKPGSLTPDEVYAVTAFLLYRNGIIGENDVLDARSLPKVKMPNRNGFVPATPVWPAPKKPSWW